MNIKEKYNLKRKNFNNLEYIILILFIIQCIVLHIYILLLFI